MKFPGLLVASLAALITATPTYSRSDDGLSHTQKGPSIYRSQPMSSSQNVEAEWMQSEESILQSMYMSTSMPKPAGVAGTTLTKRAFERTEPTGEPGVHELDADHDIEHSLPTFEANHNIAPPQHIADDLPSVNLHAERRGLKNETQKTSAQKIAEFMAKFEGSDNSKVEANCKYEYKGCIEAAPLQDSKKWTCSCNVSKLGRVSRTFVYLALLPKSTSYPCSC